MSEFVIVKRGTHKRTGNRAVIVFDGNRRWTVLYQGLCLRKKGIKMHNYIINIIIN